MPQPTPKHAATVVAPPQNWPVLLADSQDRWTVSVPKQTVQRRQMEQYVEDNPGIPPMGWSGESFGPYVRVTWEQGRRTRSTVLKVDLQGANSADTVTLSPLVFGREVSEQTVALRPARLAQHRWARLRTLQGGVRIAGLVAGVVSAWITASFAIGRSSGDAVLRFSSGAEFTLLIGAAVLAVGSAVAMFVASELLTWDVPDQMKSDR
jgi:hypothetical protein